MRRGQLLYRKADQKVWSGEGASISRVHGVMGGKTYRWGGVARTERISVSASIAFELQARSFNNGAISEGERSGRGETYGKG